MLRLLQECLTEASSKGVGRKLLMALAAREEFTS